MGEDFLDIDIWMSSLYFFTLNQLVTLFGVGCGIYSMFKTDGTIDKIFTGGAGKAGSTVAGTSVLSPASPLLLTKLDQVPLRAPQTTMGQVEAHSQEGRGRST